jgi:hypothetical protein
MPTAIEAGSLSKINEEKAMAVARAYVSAQRMQVFASASGILLSLILKAGRSIFFSITQDRPGELRCLQMRLQRNIQRGSLPG